MEHLLEARKTQKKRKPKFIRQDAHKKKRVGKGWRRSKGTNSKMRQSLRGYRKSIRIGYKSPSLVRGFSRCGLAVVNVEQIEALKNIDAKKEGIIVSRTLGMKKKIPLLTEALKLKIKVLNYKNPVVYLENAVKNFDDKKKGKAAIKKAKEQRDKKNQEKAAKVEKETKTQESKEKKTEDKKTLDDIAADKEEATKKAKKEQDKLLIKQ